MSEQPVNANSLTFGGALGPSSGTRSSCGPTSSITAWTTPFETYQSSMPPSASVPENSTEAALPGVTRVATGAACALEAATSRAASTTNVRNEMHKCRTGSLPTRPQTGDPRSAGTLQAVLRDVQPKCHATAAYRPLSGRCTT